MPLFSTGRFDDPLCSALSESTSVTMLRAITQANLTIPILSDHHLPITFVCQQPQDNSQTAPLVWLHGFDSSLLEFRRLLPLLAEKREAWAVDLLGFGFTNASPDPLPSINPETIKQHLHGFWQQVLGERPMVLGGASMGGATAIDFALTYPEAVEQLVLLDSAGLTPGPWIGRYLVPPLDRWAVAFLRRADVRRGIARNAYHDPDRFVTADSEACASLYLELPQWADSIKSFTKSGGYPSLRHQLPQLKPPALVLWGRHDRILGTQAATTLSQLIPQSRLHWLERSGHLPHLEQPEETATVILSEL